MNNEKLNMNAENGNADFFESLMESLLDALAFSKGEPNDCVVHERTTGVPLPEMRDVK